VRLVQLVGSRKRKVTRVRLGHVPSVTTGDEARAGVEQRQVAEVTRQTDQVLDAEGVHLECLVERRIEVDHARDVDHDVDVTAQSIAQIRVQPAVRLDDVAGDRRHLLAQELGEAQAVFSTQRVEHLAGGDLFVVALLRIFAALGAQGQVDVADIREAAEQERPPHLAQEAGAADHDQALAGEQLA
jgi:hypothetical protein